MIKCPRCQKYIAKTETQEGALIRSMTKTSVAYQRMLGWCCRCNIAVEGLVEWTLTKEYVLELADPLEVHGVKQAIGLAAQTEQTPGGV